MILLSESFRRAEVLCILLVDFQMNADEYSEFWQVSLMAHGSGDGTCRASTCLQGKLGWRGEREILENMRGFSHGFLQQELCELLQGELWELYTSLGKGEGFHCRRLLKWNYKKRSNKKWWFPQQWNGETVTSIKYNSYNSGLLHLTLGFVKGSRICLRWGVWTLGSTVPRFHGSPLGSQTMVDWGVLC